jgi:hypothetical protein
LAILRVVWHTLLEKGKKEVKMDQTIRNRDGTLQGGFMKDEAREYKSAEEFVVSKEKGIRRYLEYNPYQEAEQIAELVKRSGGEIISEKFLPIGKDKIFKAGDKTLTPISFTKKISVIEYKNTQGKFKKAYQVETFSPPDGYGWEWIITDEELTPSKVLAKVKSKSEEYYKLSNPKQLTDIWNKAHQPAQPDQALIDEARKPEAAQEPEVLEDRVQSAKEGGLS